MVKLNLSLELNYDIAAPGCDFIFNIQAAQTQCQTIVEENLQLNQPLTPDLYRDPWSGNRYLRLNALPGPFKLQYAATIELAHFIMAPPQLLEVPISRLPGPVLQYLYPSRYCQSDRLHKLAVREFGHLWQGYSRVQAIQDWVRNHVTFTSNTSNASTSAIDTLIDQVGVCRDFAHLMISLCRAVNIPARFATGIDYGANQLLGPTDFHAYVEVYLGNRWYIFDPSGVAIPMGFVRFATGRDAADAAFAMLFGSVQSAQPIIAIQAVVDDEHVLPYHSADALSTDN
ncbi:MAG: transglutaminase domain protein [Verrucomicrobiaceae bacterium]|nr:transglutaminase domain protein [Verrucomicrobiaceae bacterium]